jgi:hypothetical protein
MMKKYYPAKIMINVLFSFEIIIIYTLIVIISVKSVHTTLIWWINSHAAPGDYFIFYNAGIGNFFIGYVYRHWLSFIFSPFSWFNPYHSYLVWVGIQTACLMMIVHNLFKVRYGWILAPLLVFTFKNAIMNGNITYLLLLLSMYKYTSLISVFIKPHYAIFSLIHYFKDKMAKEEKKNYYYLLALFIIFLISFPSSGAIKFGFTQGSVFSRPDNVIMILVAYYIFMNKKNYKTQTLHQQEQYL